MSTWWRPLPLLILLVILLQACGSAVEVGGRKFDPNRYVIHSDEALSPDGRWTARDTTAQPRQGYGNTYTLLELIDQQGQSRTLHAHDGDHGLVRPGASMANILGWSPESTFFYYRVQIYGFYGTEGCPLFVNANEVVQVERETGEITSLASGQVSVALAPAGGQLALLRHREPTLTIHDLATGMEQPIPLAHADETTRQGQPVWAPDGRRIFLTIAHAPCTPEATYSLVEIALGSAPTQKLLLHKDRRRLAASPWRDGRLVLESSQGGAQEWLLDPQTGALTESR